MPIAETFFREVETSDSHIDRMPEGKKDSGTKVMGDNLGENPGELKVRMRARSYRAIRKAILLLRSLFQLVVKAQLHAFVSITSHWHSYDPHTSKLMRSNEAI